MTIQFKQDRYIVVHNAAERASNSAYFAALRQMDNMGHGPMVDTLKEYTCCAIREAVRVGIMEGLTVLLDAQYTDDDFERDITLK